MPSDEFQRERIDDEHLRAPNRTVDHKLHTMANTLLIEGSFEELSEELAVYIDGLSQSSVQSEVAPLLKDGNKVDALKKIVTASSALNSAPERGETLFPLADSLARSY